MAVEIDKPLSIMATNGRLDRIGESLIAIESGQRMIVQLELAAQVALFTALAYLHQATMGDGYRAVIPYMPMLGIFAAFFGWFFNELERDKSQFHKRAMVKCEQHLRAIGAYVPAFESIDDDGNPIEREIPQITALGTIYGVIAAVWVLPALIYLNK